MQQRARRGGWTPYPPADRRMAIDRVAAGEAGAAENVAEGGGGDSPGPRRARARRGGLGWPFVSAVLFAGVIYLVWEAVSLAGLAPAFILPAPLQVAQQFGVMLSDGSLLSNVGVTLQEALGGFALAALVAGVCGYAVAHVRPLEILAAPFIAASQAIPVVAVAPIIILLLGSGLRAKVVICAVVVVFPLLITMITGLRSIERDYYDVARVFGASRWQTIRLVELPLAAPVLFGGLKLGLTLSIIGAVVGEFVAADSGLGFLVNLAINNFEKSTAYVALISLVVLSVALFGLITLVERRALRWRDA